MNRRSFFGIMLAPFVAPFIPVPKIEPVTWTAPLINKWIIFKSNPPWEAGYVYAPWIPKYKVPQVILDEMMLRPDVIKHYAEKPLNKLNFESIDLKTGKAQVKVGE